MNKRIEKVAIALARLGERVWDNTMLTISTKMKVYQVFVLSALLCGSENWTLLRCLRRIFGITWQDRLSDNYVLAQAGVPRMLAFLSQRLLR